MNNLSHATINFNHFSLSERKLIENLSRKGFSVSAIANLLGKHQSITSRELNNKTNTDFVRVSSKVKRVYVATKFHSFKLFLQQILLQGSIQTF